MRGRQSPAFKPGGEGGISVQSEKNRKQAAIMQPLYEFNDTYYPEKPERIK